MNEMNTVKIGSKEYTVRLASNRQAKKMSLLLGVNILKKGEMNKIDWDKIYEDEELEMKILGLILGGDMTDSILDDLTVGDLGFLVSGFCLAVQRITLEPSNGLKPLKDSINDQMDSLLQRVTSSTLPSTPPQEETSA